MDKELWDEQFFHQLQTLQFGSKLRGNHGLNGMRKSHSKGSSVEFSDFREYVMGDDFRKIDWNAYGRFEKLYVKEFMEERELPIHILIDTSRSMAFGKDSKQKMALQLAAAFAYLGMKHQDKVLVHYAKNQQIETSKSYRGSAGFYKLLEWLEMLSFSEEKDFLQSITSWNVKDGGVTILLSDFFSTIDLERVFQYLFYRKQRILCVRIRAKEEEEILLSGTYEFIDSETKERMRITLNREHIKQYENTLNAQTKSMERISKKYGIHMIPISSSQSLGEVFVKKLSSTGWLNHY